MDNFDQIMNQLKDSAGEFRSNIHLLDKIVPVEEQIEYFQYSKYLQSDKLNNKLNRDFLIAKLFTPEVELEDRRYYLSLLAGIVDVAAYRAIETYYSSPLEPELANWSAMALVESKILLDTDFSGEKQFFVSTGLGGKNSKLRFFTVIATLDRSDFTDFQKETLFRELKFNFEHNNIELETSQIRNNYVTMLILSDFNHDARVSIEQVIDECNEYGSYLDPRFLLTNMKQLEDSNIEELLSKSEIELDDEA